MYGPKYCRGLRNTKLLLKFIRDVLCTIIPELYRESGTIMLVMT